MTGAAGLQQRLIDQLRDRGLLPDRRVEAAFRAVPRHPFLPGHPLDEVYSDRAIPTRRSGEGAPTSSSSQPAIMAIMLRQLDARPGHRVLEVGAGTGYNAALLAHLVAPGGSVVAVDIDPDVAAEARANLEAAGVDGVEVVTGDGALGYPAGAPFDRVIVTCGPSDLPPAWRQQLAPAGTMVVPLAIMPGVSLSCAFHAERDVLVARSLEPCGFMPMRGELGGRDILGLEVAPGVTIGLEPDLGLSAGTVRRWLEAPPRVLRTSEADVPGDPAHRLGLVDEGEAAVVLHAVAGGLDGPWPIAARSGEGVSAWGMSYGVATPAGLALVGRTGRRVAVFGYGPDASPAERLRGRVEASARESGWPRRLAGVRAYPAGVAPDVRPGERVFERRWSTVVVELTA